MTIMILTITVFMLFGFSVVSLYFIVKMHQMLQTHTINQDHNFYNKQEDLRRLDLFGLMPKLTNPKIIDLLILIGRAILDKPQAMQIEASFDPNDPSKRLISVLFKLDGNSLLITLEQENFLPDQASLYRIRGVLTGDIGSILEEYITHEPHLIEWIDEALQEFELPKVKKIHKT